MFIPDSRVLDIINDNDKFDCVVRELVQETAAKVQEVFSYPLKDGKYRAIKVTLIQVSEWERD